MKHVDLEKAAMICLILFIITFGATIVSGLFLVIAACAGLVYWTTITIFEAIGALVSVVCLTCWFVLLMIQIMKE